MTTHGMTGTKLYRQYVAMKERCNDPNHHAYQYYGAKGIKVCDSWQNSFVDYFSYVSKLFHFGEEGYSLDRIMNSGDYEPNNVKYSTAKQQANNRNPRSKNKVK